jgi:hypothetical protein
MNLITKKLFTSSLLMVTAVGIVFSQPNPMNNPTEVAAESLTFTITPGNFPNVSTSTATTAEVLGSITVSGVQIDLGVKNATRNTSGTPNIELTKNAAALYNINPLPGTITSILITQKTGQANTLHVGSTSRIVNSTAGNYSVLSGTSAGNTTVSSTSQSFTSANFAILGTNNNLSYFAFFPSGGSDSQIESIAFTMAVSSIVVTSGQTYSFAVDLLAQTDNKFGLCTDVGLKWSFSSVSPAETSSTANPVTLEGQFAKLTESQQTAFKTDTTDTQIVLARQRYIYLRTVTPSLVNFANI